MGLSSGQANEILVKDDLYVIRARGRVVWFELTTPRNLDPARGAAAARSITAYLLEQVLPRRSPWLGLILDVRRGPSVVGPVTMQMLEQIFAQAELARKPLAALIGGALAQAEQFGAAARAHAPRFAHVTDSEKAAVDWMALAGT